MSKAGFDKLLTELIIKRAETVVRGMEESQVEFDKEKGKYRVKD